MAIKACGKCGKDYSATYTMCPACGNREGQGDVTVKVGVGTQGKLRASGRAFKVVSTGCNDEVDIEFLDRSKETVSVKEADLLGSATIDATTLPPSDEDDDPGMPFMGMGLWAYIAARLTAGYKMPHGSSVETVKKGLAELAHEYQPSITIADWERYFDEQYEAIVLWLDPIEVE